MQAAPVLFTGQPCFDINSEGENMPNPFIQQVCACVSLSLSSLSVCLSVCLSLSAHVCDALRVRAFQSHAV
jgi:hypothetical protein